MKGGAALHKEWAVAVRRVLASARVMQGWIAVAAVFAVLLLASTPGLAGHGHEMHGHGMHGHGMHGESDMHEAQSDAMAAGSAAATRGQVEAGSIAAVSAAASDEHDHPCGSHDAGCKRISSCVSCVSAIASMSDAMPLPYAVRSLRKAPDAMILAGVPPGKLQRPPKPSF